MGTWDELCLVCGITPAGGPYSLLSRYSLDTLAHEIASEIVKDVDDGLLPIVTNALASSFSERDRELGYRKEWLPDGLDDSAEFATCMAIGYFSKDPQIGFSPFYKDRRVPDGRNVQVRRVRQGGAGDFHVVVRAALDEDGEPFEEEERIHSECSVVSADCARHINPSFFVCERCYHYLEAWLDRPSLPPRSMAFPSDVEPMSFPGEFYEIVNSRTELRDVNSALLPCINYDGIEDTLVQFQSDFAPGRRGSRHIAQGIREGLRGSDLIPAIMRDFRCWMFMRTNIWPVPASPSIPSPTFKHYDIRPNSASPEIHALPPEILLPILSNISLLDFLSLSSTCRILRTRLTSPIFMNNVLREALLHGSLQYILPVKNMPGEAETAHAAAQQWLSTIADVQAPSSFASRQFPYLAFARACCESDSMRNRKRIWGQVEQFRLVWKNYRMKGWEVDRFYPSDGLSL